MFPHCHRKHEAGEYEQSYCDSEDILSCLLYFRKSFSALESHGTVIIIAERRKSIRPSTSTENGIQIFTGDTVRSLLRPKEASCVKDCVIRVDKARGSIASPWLTKKFLLVLQ